ncbi:hypothetical protein Agabi119p4_2520 [Agaricus bisporus var. burnettii]|uniref:Integrase catalytic domain-containing protein n=2 Tax=Agaricus bisporus var. burnettii TaxID=192524 RepID=A0A8H7F9L9_AGABI|nr:hypothetical protein Agabi119p4_2520 [Agaricus bisporus var. burnettii]
MVASKRRPEPENSSESDQDSDSEEDEPILDKSKKKKQELPYRNVPALKPVVEVPPLPARYFEQPKEKITDKKINYRHQAPVEKDIDVERVVDRNLAEKVPITHEELLALSPKYRSAYKDRMTRKRISANLQEIEDSSDESDVATTRPVVQVNLNNLSEARIIQKRVQGLEGPSEESWVVEDPILQYLETLSEEERRSRVFVARESETLRVVATTVNGVRNEEALLDNGSQIISMSRDAAIACQLAWDPDITINMQSANNQVQRTCGLAKDVPFSMGGITVYLQVHVMENPAYRVLLGRPFDVLTESQISNLSTGGQILVIRDPNTKRRATAKFLDNLEELSEGQGEVICIIEQERNKAPRIAEVLATTVDHFTKDELKTIFLTKSQEAQEMTSRDNRVVATFMKTLGAPLAQQAQVVAMEESEVNDNQSELDCLVAKKYKPVALKVRPVLSELPDRYRIKRHIIGDPLAGMPQLPTHPPEFTPKGRYTQERMEKMDAGLEPDFLWPEERKLMHNVIREQNEAFAWDDSERGSFKEEYFPPIEIPTIAHVPWVEKNRPIPPVIYDEVCKIIKRKIEAGVYEPSNSSYRSRWFCVIKKDGKSLRLVHSLEPLNKVTIAHSGLPPATEELAMHFAGRACNGVLDLYVGYDERVLAESSRDLTTFQTPFGALRLVTLPMGWTNSVPIFHDDVTYILQDEIPEFTMPYIDDVPIRGPLSRYELPGGKYETIPENSGIRRFVWEHFVATNRILQRMKYSGGTFSGPKTILCADTITVVGFHCSYKGRMPTSDSIGIITRWGPCEDTTDVRSFLGTAVRCRNHIPKFISIAAPLYDLLRKGRDFHWGPVEQQAMDELKEAIRNCFPIRKIQFSSDQPVVLSVDSSWRAVGYYIYQKDEEDPKIINYIKFNSFLMDERQQRYSQPKRELCGLRMSLEEEMYLLKGCRNLIVETDATYLYGMLNNPGRLPGAASNRWVDFIRTNFVFTLVHKPGKTHGPDGLSRRKPYPGDSNTRRFNDGSDDEGNDFVMVKSKEDDADPLDFDDFVKEIDTRTGYVLGIASSNGLATSVTDFHKELDEMRLVLRDEDASKTKIIEEGKCSEELKTFLTSTMNEKLIPDLENRSLEEIEEDYDEERRSDEAKAQDERLPKIKIWHEKSGSYNATTQKSPEDMKFFRAASHFFLDKSGRFYRKSESGNHQLVVDKVHRMYMMKAAHDYLGHRGVYATARLITQRFWWPEVEKDVSWYVRSCHICQVRQKMAMELPPVVTHTPSVFQVLHADTMHISPSSNGCSYLVHGRCALTSWMEARALRKENAKAIGQWLFEDIICRWGCIVKVVTDNGAPFRKAVKWLEEKYGIRGVAISPYNSQANGTVERPHWDVRQMLFKATGGDVKKWYWYLHHIMWADRITIRKGTGCSPYFMVTGAHPTLPLDVQEATWLVQYPKEIMTTEELIALRAQALAKHTEHVEAMRQRVTKEKEKRAAQLEESNKAKIKTYDFKPGDLVLVKNSAIEMSADRKMKPRYLGPMVVITRSKGGAYILAEMDGSVWHNKVATKRVVPYLARKRIELPQNLKEMIDVSPETLLELQDDEDISELHDLDLGIGHSDSE